VSACVPDGPETDLRVIDKRLSTDLTFPKPLLKLFLRLLSIGVVGDASIPVSSGVQYVQEELRASRSRLACTELLKWSRYVASIKSSLSCLDQMYAVWRMRLEGSRGNGAGLDR